MHRLRSAIVAAALAVCCLLALGSVAADAHSTPARGAAKTAAARRAAQQRRLRLARRQATACTSRHRARRASARARRACQNKRRKRTVRSTHSSTPGTQVSASTTPAGQSGAANQAPAAPAVASTAPCANGDLTPDPTNLVAVDAATLCLVNQVRGQHGLPALVLNSKLQLAAQRHSDDMIAQDYFAHVGPAGDDPLSRMEAVGYVSNSTSSYVVGENIAWGTLTLSTPASIVNAWVNSPEHLANILDPSFRDTGMAVNPAAPASMAQGQAGAIYTQDFGVVGS